MHVEANPKQGTQSANGIPNHYRNINISRGENSGGQSLPPDAHGQRTHTNDRTRLRTCKPVSKGSRERAIKLVPVGGRSEMHVEANPKQGTQSANGIPNHYRNINMSRRENSKGQSLPPNTRGQRTHTNDRTPFKNMEACLERKPREGHQTRRWKERNVRRSKPQTGHSERKWSPKPLQKY